MHNMVKVKPGFIPDTDTYIFLKIEILIFLIKNLNLTTSIWHLMIKNKNRDILISEIY